MRVSSRPGSSIPPALLVLVFLGAALARAQDLPSTAGDAGAPNKIARTAVSQGVGTCANRIEQATTFLGYSPQVASMLMVSPEQPDQRIVSVAMVSLVGLGQDDAARSYVVDAPTTLRLLSRRRNPESGTTRERFISMVATANPTIFPSPKLAADLPLGKGATLVLPDGLPTASHGSEGTSAMAHGYVSASFAPGKDGGCGLAYDIVISWPMNCKALAARRFSTLKIFSEYKKEILILDGDSESKIFLIPAGGDHCVSVKKQVVF